MNNNEEKFNEIMNDIVNLIEEAIIVHRGVKAIKRGETPTELENMFKNMLEMKKDDEE